MLSVKQFFSSHLPWMDRGYRPLPQTDQTSEVGANNCPQVAIDMSLERKENLNKRKLDNFAITSIVKRQLDPLPLDPPIISGTYLPKDFLERQKIVLMEHTTRTQIDEVGRILQSTEPKEGMPSVIDESTCDDLVLISGSKGSPKESVAESTLRAKTFAGRIFHFSRLSRPTDDKEIIMRRQGLLKELIKADSHEDLEKLRDVFSTLKDNELHMVSYWNPKGQMLPGRADKFFFRYVDGLDAIANQSSAALTVHATGEIIKGLVQNVVMTTAIVAMPLFVLSQLGLFGEGKVSQTLDTYEARFAGSSGPLYLVASLIPHRLPQMVASLIGGAVAAVTTKRAWQWIKVEFDFDAMIHKKMLSVARYYRAMKEVYSLVKDKPEIASRLEHFGDLDNFFKSEKLRNLFKAFESSTFDGEAGYFYKRGNVLFPWRQMESQEVQKEFAKAIRAIAEVDTVAGLAVLLQEDRGPTGATYCFPEIISNSKTPSINIIDGWHPVVGKEKSVLNSSALGEEAGIPNLLLSGPNAGGKSTGLRTASTAQGMLQSFGFAPAKGMQATIFSYIKSLMHSEDVIAKESLFEKQVNTANKIIQNVDSLPEGQFGLLAMDESFNGTNPIEGAAFAYGTAKRLSENKNSVTLFATHFSNVCRLESEGARYTNFQVELDDQGKSTYRIVPGISKHQAAVQVAQALKFDERTLKYVQQEKERLIKGG